MLKTLRQFAGQIGILRSAGMNRGGRAALRGGFASSPASKRAAPTGEYQLLFPTGVDAHEARVRLYRFLRSHVPVLNAAVWTWVKMASAELSYRVFDHDGQEITSHEIRSVVDNLGCRLYENRYQKFGGLDALMIEFFNTLFTTGSVCGELLVDSHGLMVDRFYFIDPATIRFRLDNDGDWNMHQEVEGEKIDLQQPTTYYYGMDSNSVEPWGVSLLGAVPFAARVEQALVTDMNSSMHNAGYHRIHVTIKPPDRLPGEDEEAYVSRANEYFDETVKMVRQFDPDDNPVTWNDVQIDYIGPASKISSSSSWYLNHKAVLEDICAGTHLAPFMLGYSYGATHTWAEFNFELMQRQLRTIQSAAISFLRWITDVEFALKGIDAVCRWEFAGSIDVGLLDRRRAESIQIDNVLKKLDAKLIDREAARIQLGCDG